MDGRLTGFDDGARIATTSPHMRYLALIVVAGCLHSNPRPGQTATLADLPGLQVRASSGPNWGTEVSLRYDVEAFHQQTGFPCASLGDLDATFNGVRITMESHGVWIPEEDFSEAYCQRPSLEVAYRPEPGDAPEVKVSDESASIVAHYGVDTFSWRSAELVSHDSWQFTSGSEALFTWSHPQDIRSGSMYDARYGDERASFDVPVQWNGSFIALTFPEFTGSSDGWLEIVVFPGVVEGEGDAVSCVGADRCTSSVQVSYTKVASLR
ncbi:MAG: hypothetical protein ACKV2T_18030 [Kofleriaceae bacterium]